jgi:hypothetical protein
MVPPLKPAPGGCLKDYGDTTPSKEHSPKVFSPAKRHHEDFAGRSRSESESDEDSLGTATSLTFKHFKTTGDESPPVVDDSPTVNKVDCHDGP